MFSFSISTVQYICKRYYEEDRIEDKPATGNRRILSSRDERFLIRKIRENPKTSAPKLTKMLEGNSGKVVNPETVRKILRKTNFHDPTARKKPVINEANRQKRLDFAIAYKDKDLEFWKNVIFADESKYNIFGSDGKIKVWRKPNTEIETKNIVHSVKHGGGNTMVWGCMAYNGVGNIEFVETTMNKESYLAILKRNLHQSAVKLGIKDTFKFYQDNDPKHKSYMVRSWLLYNCPKVIETPPQSPDLHVIEHLLYTLEKKLEFIA